MRANFDTRAGSSPARDVPRPLPPIAQAVQAAPDGLARDLKAAPRFQLQRQSGATPTGTTPAGSGRCSLQQREQRAVPTEQRRPAGRAHTARSQASPLVSCHATVNTGARAEQERGNLRRCVTLRAQQQDMNGKQVAVTRLPQLAQQPVLFF